MSSDICKAIEKCRICGSPELSPVLDLGEQYIATHFVANEVPDFLQNRYPLQLVRCSAKDACGLVQLAHSLHPRALYYDYGYLSGINQSMRSHLAEIAAAAETRCVLQPGDTVLDIGCNDGTLLCSYRTQALDRVGIDASANTVKLAREKGLEVVNSYFSAAAFASVRPNRKARVITSIAMFYDLEDPRQFAADVASILADDGLWVIELSYLPLMLQQNSYDTVCHEHLEYYSLKPIEWLLAAENLMVQDIEFNEINGGSFRLFIRRQNNSGNGATETVRDVRAAEECLQLDTDLTYRSFAGNAFRVRDDLKTLLTRLIKEEQKIYLYGASTKGNTILQFCEIDNSMVPKAAERNANKWGRHTLGTNIEIISEAQARDEQPDYFLVLPWHFFNEFKLREKTFLERGGKFILPLPEVKVVGISDL
jgi:NDP-4-keto-2,6-dideoxyhexose 3-C-methyltransferase